MIAYAAGRLPWVDGGMLLEDYHDATAFLAVGPVPPAPDKWIDELRVARDLASFEAVH